MAQNKQNNSNISNIKITRSFEFNIVRSELTKSGELIGGQLIKGDKSYSSFDEAIDSAISMFMSEGAPMRVRYSIISGVTREYYRYANICVGSVSHACKNNKEVKDEILVHSLPLEFPFAKDARGYTINFFNQENHEMFIHPTISK